MEDITIAPLKSYDEGAVLALYAAVGWTNYTQRPEMLRRAFAGSLCTLCAYDGGRIAGLVRAVGDGASVLCVQDLLVLPEYQRRGLGSRLLRELLARYPDVYQTMLLTDDTPEHAAFYEHAGFTNAAKYGGGAYLIVK